MLKLQHYKGALQKHISMFPQLLLHQPSMAIKDIIHLFVNILQEKVKTHAVLHEPTIFEEAP